MQLSSSRRNNGYADRQVDRHVKTAQHSKLDHLGVLEEEDIEKNNPMLDDEKLDQVQSLQAFENVKSVNRSVEL